MQSWKVVVLLLLVGSRAGAAVEGISLDDVLTAHSLGMGGAYRALGASPDALDGNPATLAMQRTYQVDLGAAWDVTNKVFYTGTFVRDSSTLGVATGVGYHLLSTGRGTAREISHVTTAAVGIPLGDAFSIGFSGRYLARSHPKDTAEAVTMDAGAAIRLSEGLTLALAAHNFIGTRHPELPRLYSAGVGLTLPSFSLDVDARSQLSGGLKPIFNAGGEYLLAGFVGLRGGYIVETQSGHHYFSGGVGLSSGGTGLDLAYRHELHGASNLWVLSLRLQL